jgi:putative membrane protein
MHAGTEAQVVNDASKPRLPVISSASKPSIAPATAKAIARLFARKCGKLRYGKLMRGVVVFLLLMILMLTGVLGLFVAGAATAIGVLPPIIGVRRVHLMGSLILPAILLLAF